MSSIKRRGQQTVHSKVEVVSYKREVHDRSDASGLAIVETRLRERFSGGLDGEGFATHLRLERSDGSGSLICYERIRARLDGRSGAFLLVASGEMSSDQYVHGKWEILEGTGTDELTGIRGTAAFMAKRDPHSQTGWVAETALTFWFDPSTDDLRQAPTAHSQRLQQTDGLL